MPALLDSGAICRPVVQRRLARAETRRRATEEDPVLQKLDQLASELQSLKTELEHRAPRTADPGDPRGRPQPASDEPVTDDD